MEIDKSDGLAGIGIWAGVKIFGPTLDQMGEDLKDAYILCLQKMMSKAGNKKRAGKETPNLRITSEILASNPCTADEMTTEYFGGVLASSLSSNGQDDTSIYYLNIIKSMSSRQLAIHYAIYRTLNMKLNMTQEMQDLNPAMGTELHTIKLFIATKDILTQGDDVVTIMHSLSSLQLISNWRADNFETAEGPLPYMFVSPNALGIQLYAIANNSLEEWRHFATKNLDTFEDNKGTWLPNSFGLNKQELFESAGLEMTDTDNE